MDVPLVIMTALVASMPNWGGFVLMYFSHRSTIKHLFDGLEKSNTNMDRRLAVAEGQLLVIQNLFQLLLTEYRLHPDKSPVPDAPTKVMENS